MLIEIARRYGLGGLRERPQGLRRAPDRLDRHASPTSGITAPRSCGRRVEPELDAELAPWMRARARLCRLDRLRAAAAPRMRVEDKGPIVAFHWRGDARRGRGRGGARRDRRGAPERRGWRPHWGRKVLEMRPPVRSTRGRASRGSCATPTSTPRCTSATTTPTSTRSAACDELVEAGRVATRAAGRRALRRGTPSGLGDAADLIVDGTERRDRAARGAARAA